MNKLHRSELICLNNLLGIELANKMARSCPLLSALILKRPGFRHLCIQMREKSIQALNPGSADFMPSTGFGDLLENWLINLQLSSQGLAHKHGRWGRDWDV